MARPRRVQIVRRPRKDGSVTFSLRVRTGGTDARVPLGNTTDGWDEARADTARKQLLAKMELGLWTPHMERPGDSANRDTEPTLRELATDWLEARKRNPAVRPRTTELNESQLTRYLLPFFGELHPSQITVSQIKQYRENIHQENSLIRDAGNSDHPLRDARSGQRLRTLSNTSINKTLITLALILDDAEDAGWIDRNPARGRRTREPLERHRNRGTLDVDEFLQLLDAADELDNRHLPRTLERASFVRELRDKARLDWKRIAAHVGVASTTAMYLYQVHDDPNSPPCGPRRAIIATLGLAGPRVGELCALNNQDIDLQKRRVQVRDAKTEAGVRSVDIHPRLLEELVAYRATRSDAPVDAPAFPTRTGGRRDRNNVLHRIVEPVLRRANEVRATRGDSPILTHVTPHTFRRTYITFMIAAGYDLPYVQAQVGHVDPSTTLAVYAQVIRGADRDQLRAEIRELLGVSNAERTSAAQSTPRIAPRAAGPTQRRTLQKAPKGPTVRR